MRGAGSLRPAWFWSVLAIGLALTSMARAAAPVWVLFADKPGNGGQPVPWPVPEQVRLGAELDAALDEDYIDEVEALGLVIRSRSRWFNAVSVDATPGQTERLRALTCVRQVRPVHAWRRPPLTEGDRPLPPPAPRAAGLDYGSSLAQAAAVGLPPLHDQNILGQGVRIAVIDAGFNWRDHRAFEHLAVVATRDFINDDDEVGDEPLEPVTGAEANHGQNRHGTSVLSVLAGHDPGRLIGAAPFAEYLLAKTDDVSPSDIASGERDLPIEEDRWVAALEWADSLGAQVVNSSLGYNRFTDGSGYAYEDLDGATALTTRAAELAVARGIVVVVAAGNEAADDWHYITVPADAPGVIAVGAVHPVSGSISSFSSRGPTADGRIKPDVVAPGQNVWGVSGRGAGAGADPFSLREYVPWRGTSFAAPIVSGACALLLQQHPQWTPAEVADALRSTATDLGPAGPDTVFGWGLIDVFRASGGDAAGPAVSAAGDPYPNPARGGAPAVHFPVSLARQDTVRLALFDIGGVLVDRLEPQALPPGTYDVPGQAPSWPVPEGLASGVYYYRVESSSFQHQGKIAIVRGP